MRVPIFVTLMCLTTVGASTRDSQQHRHGQQNGPDGQLLGRRGHIKQDITNEEKEKEVQKKLSQVNATGTKWSEKPRLWSWMEGDWAEVSLPSREHPRILAHGEFSGPFLVLTAQDPNKMIYIRSRQFKTADNAELHLNYFLTPNPDGSPLLEVYQMWGQNRSQLLARGRATGLWEHLDVDLDRLNGSKILILARRNSSDNDVAIGGVSIKGVDFLKEKNRDVEKDDKASKDQGPHKHVASSAKKSSKLKNSTSDSSHEKASITTVSSVENSSNNDTTNNTVIEATEGSGIYIINVTTNNTVTDAPEDPNSLNHTMSNVTTPENPESLNLTTGSVEALDGPDSLNLTNDNVTAPGVSNSSNLIADNVTTLDGPDSLNLTMGNVTAIPPANLDPMNTTVGVPDPVSTHAPNALVGPNSTSDNSSIAESITNSSKPPTNWTTGINGVGGSLGGGDNEDDEENAGMAFNLLVILGVMGLVLLAFLYWRNKKKRTDDEISIYSRNPYSEYANPTFEDEDTSGLPSRNRHNYKTID